MFSLAYDTLVIVANLHSLSSALNMYNPKYTSDIGFSQ